MAQIPLPDGLKDLAGALEQEVEAALGEVREASSLPSDRAARATRLAIDLVAHTLEIDVADVEVEALRAERDRALAMLRSALDDKHALEHRAAAEEQKRRSARASVRRLRSRLKESLAAQAEAQTSAQLLTQDTARSHENPEAELAEAREETQRQRVAHAAADARLAFAERERDALQTELESARALSATLQDQLEDSRRLAADLQTELADLWRLLREARPHETLSINGSMLGSDGQGVERVRAKVIDARELFRRRNRWPIAI